MGTAHLDKRGSFIGRSPAGSLECSVARPMPITAPLPERSLANSMAHPDPKASRSSAASRDTMLLHELRVGRERLQALSRRLARLRDEERDVARQLCDEAEQILIGLRLLEREPRSPTMATCVEKLRRKAEAVLESLQGLTGVRRRRSGADRTTGPRADSREREGSRRSATRRGRVQRRRDSHRKSSPIPFGS